MNKLTITARELTKQLKAGNTEGLILATEKQINTLVLRKKVNADFLDTFYALQETIRERINTDNDALDTYVEFAPVAKGEADLVSETRLLEADRMESEARRSMMEQDAEAHAGIAISGKAIALLFDTTYKFDWTQRRDGKGVDVLLLTPDNLFLLKSEFKAFKASFTAAGADNFDQRIAYLKKLSLHTLYKTLAPAEETEETEETEDELDSAYDRALLSALAYAIELDKPSAIIESIEALMSEQGIEAGTAVPQPADF